MSDSFTYPGTPLVDPSQHSSQVAFPPTKISRVLTASGPVWAGDRWYGVDLSAGPVVVTLPASATQADGCFVGLIDVLNLASAAVPITASVFPLPAGSTATPDTINNHGTIGATHLITTPGILTMYVLYKGVWRPHQFGA